MSAVSDKKEVSQRRCDWSLARCRRYLLYAIVLCINLGVLYRSGLVLSTFHVDFLNQTPATATSEDARQLLSDENPPLQERTNNATNTTIHTVSLEHNDSYIQPTTALNQRNTTNSTDSDAGNSSSQILFQQTSRAILRRPTKDEVSTNLPMHRVEDKQNQNRTAIVLVVHYLTDCGAARLKHLLQTAKSRDHHERNSTILTPQNAPRDVWVMHHHSSMKESNPLRQKSALLFKQVRAFAKTDLGMDLHFAQQFSKRWDRFDSPRSGAGKSSFLKFIAEYNYGWGWHIEDDVFYTGPWHQVFDTEPPAASHNSTTTNFDVLATGNKAPKDWPHFVALCYVRVPETIKWYDSEFSAQPRQRRRKRCHEIEPSMARWGIIRVSLRFAKTLVERVPKQWILGHHEAVVAAVCKVYLLDCSLDGLTPRIGRIVNAGWGDWRDPTTQYLDRHAPIRPQALYHPVKCAAYSPENITKILEYTVE